jgi:hypothetical protein
MSWKQKGDGKHDQVSISGSGGNDSVKHIKSQDTKYGESGSTKIVSESYSNGNKTGHTTVHGNNHVNKHGSHS